MTDYKQMNWIASFPKSGNTWVRALFNAYVLNRVDINEMVATVTDDREALHYPGDQSDPHTYPVQIQQLCRPMACLRMVRVYLKDRLPGLPLLVKTHHPLMSANGIEMIPEALTRSVIYIARDPRDVLPSFAKHMGYDLDTAVEKMTDRYNTLKPAPSRMAEFISSWGDNVRSYLDSRSHRVAFFKYEDLRERPTDTFAQMLDHVGMEVDEARVQRAVALTDLAELQKQEKEQGFVESSPHAKDQFFGQGLVGGWRDKIKPAHAFKIEKRFGSLMKRLGYIERRRAA